MAVKKQKKIPHIKKKELDIGISVILLPAHYIPTRSYPVWGSEYSCIGVIAEIQYDIGTPDGKKITLARVEWSNGTYGLFTYNTVALASNVDIDDPNIGYKVFRKGARQCSQKHSKW